MAKNTIESTDLNQTVTSYMCAQNAITVLEVYQNSSYFPKLCVCVGGVGGGGVKGFNDNSCVKLSYDILVDWKENGNELH